MEKVICDIQETSLENEDGYEVAGVEATCRECGPTTESFGTEEMSIARCLALMREECPKNQRHFYIEDPGEVEWLP